MTKLKQLQIEELEKLIQQMENRHDFMTKVKDYVDKYSISGLNEEQKQGYLIFEKEGFKKYDEIKGVMKKLKRAAAKYALVRLSDEK